MPTPLDPLAELALLAASLGGVACVQGAGGNISVKSEGALLVKASGLRLRDAASERGCSTVPLAEAEAALAGDAEADRALFAHRPRPSMETYFHALPARIVAHTHPVGVALLASSTSPAPASFAGAPVVDVPYVSPGRGLAVAMRERLAEAPVQLFLLRNHGLVALAPGAAEAAELTVRFAAACLAAHPAAPPFEAECARWLKSPRHAVGAGFVARTLPHRTISVAHAPRYLFPDAVVYGFVRRVEHASIDAARMHLELRPAWFKAPTVLEDDLGLRVLVARDAEQLDRATEIAAAHDWVERALEASGTARYLAASEPAALLDLPAEKFRQQVS